VTLILLIVLPLVAILLLLISSMSNGSHYTPQAYYRRKRLGAPVAFGIDALGPRPRRRLPGEPAQAATGAHAEIEPADPGTPGAAVDPR